MKEVRQENFEYIGNHKKIYIKGLDVLLEQMQKLKGLLDVARKEKTAYKTKLQECETKHTKEIEELWKFYEDQAKVRVEDYKKKKAENPTTQEKKPEKQHRMTKTPAIPIGLGSPTTL